MKKITDFKLSEWLKLKPLQFLLKELRNNIFLNFYLRCKTTGEEDFKLKCKKSNQKNLLAVIAFEEPRVLEWMFTFGRKNITSFELLIFDNSRDQKIRNEIEAMCNKYGVMYLPLPKNPTTHPNRSHGMAMSWIYHRIIKYCEPNWFGFIDHDLIPVAKNYDEFVLSDQIFYGVCRENRRTPGVWSLWAGYCFFKYDEVKNLAVNFLYDFSRNLDTGGRNWDVIYSHYDKNKIKFAEENFINLVQPNAKGTIQLIDQSWVHIGGVSYSENLNQQANFYKNFFNELSSGKSIEAVLSATK